MTKIRLFFLSLTLVVVTSAVWLISLYARGYRFNSDSNSLTPNGILVIKSVPDGAQIIIDGELKGATNANIPLPPATYDITIRREGFIEWNKRLTIEKEVVTETTAHLFRNAPSLAPVTFEGAQNPVASDDLSKIAYFVPTRAGDNEHNEKNAGLWVLDTINLPVGFSREPRKVTDGNLENALWEWSPNSREILLTTPNGIYLLDAGSFTPQSQLVNISFSAQTIKEDWQEERRKEYVSSIRSLPDELTEILERRVYTAVFSNDNDMILYTASSSASLADNLIEPVPGASTQKQDRDIKPNHTYVYDIEEDRNFLIDEDSNNLMIGNVDISNNSPDRRLTWFPTSRHLVLAEKNNITIMDYDSTNRQVVFSGNYEAPHAFASVGTDKLLIVTNLGADSTSSNIYTLNLK
ncbi:MAG: PEGA domain-containing protein [Candidatus Woesebacteria bacterium]|jgi:hypothetical protein